MSEQALKTLRPYQAEFSEKARRVLLRTRLLYMGWGVRTGKTCTSLDICQKLRGEQPFDNFKVLFLTTKKTIGSVMADYEDFGFDLNITVINYESAHQIDMIEIERFDVVILDEAHKLGAFPKKSEKNTLVRDFIDQHTYVILMSGTPAAESQSSLYHQLDVSPYSPWSQYKNFYNWCNDGYVNVTTKNHGYGDVRVYDDAVTEKVEADIKHLLFTKTQEETNTFSKRIKEHVLKVPMSKITTGMVARLLKDKIIVGKDIQKRIIGDTPAKLQQKIHQLSSGTIKFDEDDEGNQLSMTIDNSKALAIKEKFGSERIAILYNFIQEGKMLEHEFPNFTRDWKDFDEDPTKVFIGQVISCREGISLWKAEHLIFFNIPFSAVSYLQGRDRLTKAERKEDNNVWFLCSDFDDGICEKIYRRVQNKEDYNERLFRLDYNLTKKGDQKKYRQKDIGRGKNKKTPPPNQMNLKF